jgi:hypothetical protein
MKNDVSGLFSAATGSPGGDASDTIEPTKKTVAVMRARNFMK